MIDLWEEKAHKKEADAYKYPHTKENFSAGLIGQVVALRNCSEDLNKILNGI